MNARDKMRKLALFALAFTLLLAGCQTSDTNGNFQLYLTDQAIDGLEHVYITIGSIQVEKDDDSVITLWEGTETYDLLALQGVEEQMVDVDLEAGTYTAVIIELDAVSIVINGRTIDLSINPGWEVRIPVTFTITDEGNCEVVLDFEADSSLDGYGDQYYFIPVISIKRIGY